MKDGKYNIQDDWSVSFDKQVETALRSELPIQISGHAYDRIKEKGIAVKALTKDKLLKSKCVEVEVKNDKVFKMILRYGYNDKFDAIAAILIKKDCLFCKSIWLNSKNDNHYSLNHTDLAHIENKNIEHISPTISELLRNK